LRIFLKIHLRISSILSVAMDRSDWRCNTVRLP
jgi:hypothetical protein